ncbi:phage/plasmid primase, P4 family [uncultured Enterovirga sp.]|uniref:phage/plasmid primase, P4 family n=1 Tax=uncultured Enterovirga sp. TaxID=2026352 RepID=UPI0035CCA1D3
MNANQRRERVSSRARNHENLADAAVAYARRGLAVLPLHTIEQGVCTCSRGGDCTSPGKHPILVGGVHGATCDPTAVARLWQDHPAANVGIATGAVSNLVAIDIDPRNGGSDTARALKAELGPPPRSALSLTGGRGQHYMFSYPDGGLPTRHDRALLPGVDVQSDGAFIVAPPSRHVSGRRYRWKDGRDVRTIRPATLPAAWLEKLRQPPPAPEPQTAASSSPGSIVEGSRNSFLATFAGTLHRAGSSREALSAALKAENAARCSPPLDDAEVERIAASTTRYNDGQLSADEAEGVMRAVLNGHFAGGAHLIRPADGRFWTYDGTRWITLDRQVLSGVVLRAIQAMPARRGHNSSSLLQQVLRLIEPTVATAGDPLRFIAAPLPVINTRTGEIWIGADGSFELKPHDPASYLRHRFEVDYDPEATCPRYDQAVREIFGKATNPNAMATFWHELMGYAMQPDRPIATVVLGWGPGNNGKTKLVETFVKLVGFDLVHAMPIGDIEKSRFTAGSLLGKLAIYDDDVRAGTRLPDGDLKRYSEEKTVTGENKYGPSFTFTARTVVVMLFNNPPSLADLSYGMQRRLTVVPFDRTFSKEETKPGLFKLIWQEEMPGILNRYLAGLQRVIRRGWRLTPPAAVLEAKAALLRAANPLPAFLEECCERTDEAWVKDLHAAYGEWATQAGITMAQQRLSFGRNLKSLGFEVVHGSRGDKVIGLRLASRPEAGWPHPA